MISKLRPNLSIIVLVLSTLILIINLGNALFLYARHAVMAVNFPYPLDYSEGPILDQVQRLAQGETIYRTSLDTPPFTITLTPPLYMLLQAPLARTFGLSLAYGRVLSILSLCAAALFLGLTLFHLTQDWLASVIGGLLLFTVPYFFFWSVLDQVDSLALALSWAGIYATVRWPDQRKGLVLAALLFTAAVFTRQTYALAAPFTALAWLAQTRRFRRAIFLLISTAGIGLLLFVGLNTFTGGGFLMNLATFDRVNPWFFEVVFGRIIEFSIHAFILYLVAFVFLLAERLGEPTPTWPLVLPYMIGAILITTTIGKAISHDNFMYELAAALCLASGAAIAWMKIHWARAAVFILIAIQVSSFVSWTQAEYQPVFDEKRAYQSEIQKLAGMIQASDSPILIDEYMGLLPLAGKQVYYQPFEFGQLELSGAWNPEPLMTGLKQHQFSALMIYFPKQLAITQTRWPANIYSACWENYALADTLADTLILTPKP